MTRLVVLFLLLMLPAMFPALAIEPDEVLPDRALENRARALAQELRCLVCQNQSIDDSDAPLARDLRLLVRTRLLAGDSDAQIRSLLAARYGEFVLFRPVMAWHTAFLWLLPLLVLLFGFWLARRVTAASPPPQ